MPAPAHKTKHVQNLLYSFNNISTFNLAQLQNGANNGTALWLGGQVLACYLASLYKDSKHPPRRAIELGAGIGLASLVVGALGGDVLATDSACILDSVLRRNILANSSALSPSATVHARELDWTVPSSAWSWSDPHSITNPSSTQKEDNLMPPFDIIFTADTVYSSDLVQPLLDTILALSKLAPRPPPCYLCLERRDPLLVDAFLARAREMGFTVSRIPHQKLKRVLERADVHWEKDDWDAVELWKLQLAKAKLPNSRLDSEKL